MADVVLVKPLSLLIQPFHGSGFSSTLYLAYDERLYPVYARVLKAHPSCQDVAAGDVIHFQPNSFTEVLLSDERTLYFMDERAVDSIIDGYDTEAVAV